MSAKRMKASDKREVISQDKVNWMKPFFQNLDLKYIPWLQRSAEIKYSINFAW